MKKQPKFRNQEQEKKEKSEYEYEGFRFRFDDEALQERYVKTYNHFNKMLDIPLKEPIGYIDAVALTRGKTFDKFNQILDQYESNDIAKDKKGLKHKFSLYNDLSDETRDKTINEYVKKYDDLRKRLDTVTSHNPPKDIDSDGKLRYNIVYYTGGIK